jgi:hypothetical protein
MTIDDTQAAEEIGRHAADYGPDPGNPAARNWMRERIVFIRRAPDEVRQGAYRPKGGGGSDYWFLRQGETSCSLVAMAIS